MGEPSVEFAVSRVVTSTITRSAQMPVAAHALQAVKAAVDNCGLALATLMDWRHFAELPASGDAIVDGLSIVSSWSSP